jgi:hypothetical protein
MLRFSLGLLLLLLVQGCATPESVVRTAIEAAQSGDEAAYEGCFTPRSRPMIRAIRRAQGPTPTGGVSGSAQVHELPGGGLFWGRRVVRVTDGERQVKLVLQGEAGAWRIDLIDTERRTSSVGGRL